MRARGFKSLGLALAVAAVIAAPAYRASAADDIDAKIMSAKTAADHDAIATYYEGQAADARAKAAEHKKMGADYKKIPNNAKIHFDQHCDLLASHYASAAKQYDALAKSHHDAAKNAK